MHLLQHFENVEHALGPGGGRRRPADVPLFRADELKQIERINEEIERNGRRGLKARALPLLDDRLPA